MQSNFLKQALNLAKIRKGYCAPNPPVGAVIVRNEQVIATGYHFGAGYPHAEIEALKNLPPDLAQNLDFYITLEPCCHYGKTPPCTETIIERKISRVFYGLPDPDKRVSGKGATILESAGIPCVHLPLPEIEAFYKGYIYWQKYRRPYVTAKLALSLDNKIAGENGKPVKISGSLADEFTHEQRHLSDALFTTSRTICADNPKLNVRLPEGVFKKPIYILDRMLSIPLTSAIFDTAKQVILFHSKQVSEDKVAIYQEKGAVCMGTPDDKEAIPWDFILEEIGNAGIHNLWVEAGGYCFQSLVKGNYLQQAYLYYAAHSIGSDGLDAFVDAKNLFKNVSQREEWRLGEDRVVELLLSS